MKKIVALGVVVVVLITGTVWAYRRYRADPQVQNAVKLWNKAEQLPEDQREQARGQFRTAMQQLNADQQRQVRGKTGGGFGRRMGEQAAAFCKMSPDQRTAYVNKFIADMQKRQQEWEVRRAAEAQGSSGAQDGSGGGGPGGGPGGGGPGGGGRGGGGQGGRPGRFDQQARNQFRLQMLDNTTPEQWAQMTVFRQSVQQQCQQQGIVPPRGFGGGR